MALKLPYETRGSISPSISDVQKLKSKEDKKRSDIEALKAQCLANGGFWDSKTNSCITDVSKIPVDLNTSSTIETPKPTTPPPVKKVKPTSPELTLLENNKANLTLPSGQTLIGITKGEARGLLQNYESKKIEGYNPVGTAQAQADTAQRMQQLVEMAQQGLITPQELQAIQGASPDMGQALGAGLLGAGSGVIAGAIAGGVGGAAIGGFGAIPGAIGGAAIGGIGTFLNSMKSNIKQQQTEQFAADKFALTKGEKYLRSLITDTNQNPQNAPENIALFYQTLNNIDRAHAKTWKDSQENINRFLGNDGTKELAQFEIFDTTMRQYYIAQFEAALIRPDATKILLTPEDLENVE